ncbi:MAG TPA: hypothetical protein VJS67_14515 [Pseudonocardiaceae bacterium]|nr:hypothetical protein [Pseudonocardiaceae bacterium]
MGNGSAAEDDLGALSVVGLGDGDGVHAGPHERDTPATVSVVGRWRAPAAVVAHGQRDQVSPARRELDATLELNHSGWSVAVGVFGGVGDGFAQG